MTDHRLDLCEVRYHAEHAACHASAGYWLACEGKNVTFHEGQIRDALTALRELVDAFDRVKP